MLPDGHQRRGNGIGNREIVCKGKIRSNQIRPNQREHLHCIADALDDIPQGQKRLEAPADKTHLAMRRLQGFIAYHRKSFTGQKITFYGLRYTFALGFSGSAARRRVTELLGETWDNVPCINLSEDGRDV